EGLLWLAVWVIPMSQFGIFAFSGPILGQLANLVTLALLFVPALLVGMLCRQWQGAVALNPLAIIPAVAASLFAPYTRASYGLGGLTLFVVVAALGLLGWLLRYVRAEFAA
ncbi:MAG TPA: hypothetical protein VFX31_12060, partial [Ktedonobacterales bacterium]|nr:hypothetical protein [Ktedonobacterales bacterium]